VSGPHLDRVFACFYENHRPARQTVSLNFQIAVCDEQIRAAAEAWSLAELDRRYRAHRDTLERALAEPELPTGAEALRRYSALVSPSMVDTLRAPVLPESLYPAGWSLPALRAAIGSVNRAYTPAIRAHLAGRFAEAGEVEPDPDAGAG